MTKNEKSKKGRTAKRIAVVALLLCSLGTGITSLAKYVMEYKSDDETAKVAQYDCYVSANADNAFTTSYGTGGNNSQTIIGSKSTVTNKPLLVGPGASGYSLGWMVNDTMGGRSRTVPLRIIFEVNLTYSNEFKILKTSEENDDYYTPIKIAIYEGGYTKKDVLNAPFFNADNSLRGALNYSTEMSNPAKVTMYTIGYTPELTIKEVGNTCVVTCKVTSDVVSLNTSLNYAEFFRFNWYWDFESGTNDSQKKNANVADTLMQDKPAASVQITSSLAMEQVIG